MDLEGSSNKKIGFFPSFDCLGDTFPFIKIAEKCRAKGAKVLFFSHGGVYENLVKKYGFELIQIEPILKDAKLEDATKTLASAKQSDEYYIDIIKKEGQAFVDAEIELLVQPNVLITTVASSKYKKIPSVSVMSGVWLPEYFKNHHDTFPDGSENFFTRLLPHFIKGNLFNWLILNNKGPFVKKYNNIFKKLNITFRFSKGIDLLLGDKTLVCDDINFLQINPSKNIPKENFIGPILSNDLFDDEIDTNEKELEDFLKNKKSILITMGSTGNKKIYLKILNELNNTDYNVLAIYTNILNEEEIKDYSKNILFRKFVPDVKSFNEIADLAVIHGGRGTVYTAAYSGKPVIGIPRDLMEQQYNLDCLVRHNNGFRLSYKYFNEKKFMKSVKTIFNNYDYYHKNAIKLSKKIQKPNGDIKAARLLLDF